MSNYFDKKTSFLEPIVTEYGSGMVMTNVTKTTKTKFVNIDTRFYPQVKSNFTIDLPERISEVTSLTVAHIEVPINFFNISTSLGNNRCIVTDTSTSTLEYITLNDGLYNSSNKFTTSHFTLNSSINITIANNVTSLTNTSTTSTYSINFLNNSSDARSQLGWLLGFRQHAYTLLPGKTITSETFIDYNPIRYIYLIVDEHCNTTATGFLAPLYTSLLNKKILARITLDTNHLFGSILFGNKYNSILCSDIRKYQKTNILRLTTEMVDEWGRHLHFNGLDFSFLLKLEHE